MGSEAPGGSGTTLTTAGFSVRYDAANKSYIMDFPVADAGEFKQYSSNTPNATWWGGLIVDASDKPLTHDVSVLKPSNPELQLTYTTLVGYNYLSVSSVPLRLGRLRDRDACWSRSDERQRELFRARARFEC